MRGKEDMHHKAETLEYLRAMLGQLRGMAEAGRHDMLAYLIGMAYVEAVELSRGSERSGAKGDERDEPSGLPGQPPGQV